MNVLARAASSARWTTSGRQSSSALAVTVPLQLDDRVEPLVAISRRAAEQLVGKAADDRTGRESSRSHLILA
jgi:hypothetical protein